jgi:hypothetical protein
MNQIDSLTPDPRWFDAPRERTPQFFCIYAQVSMALQEALRETVPPALFADLDEFKNQRGAYAMLAYASSRPYRPKSRTDFTYDLTNATAMMTFYRFSKRKLTAGLAEAHASLMAAGQEELAQHYEPRNIKFILKAVKKRKRFRKPLHRLLIAEGKLVNELTAFSGLHECSVREQQKEAMMILRRWRLTFRHLCFGSDLSRLAEPLFEVATKAYVEASRMEQPETLLDLAA